jgi:ubiquinone/menaquinone biosynthesis C-methylase UbiE
MSLFDHFNIIAPIYDRVFKPVEYNRLLELVGLPVSGVLLDAGGGTGRISQFFRDQVEHVVVADLSLEMLKQARSKGGLLTTCSHTEKLPFYDQVFDRIIMVDALHHFCNQKETAEEMWRVLKPTGRIVIEEPDFRKSGIKVLALAEKLLGMRSHFLSPPSIAALFDGLSNPRVESRDAIAWIIIEKN